MISPKFTGSGAAAGACIALCAGFLTAALLILVGSDQPIQSIKAFFITPWSSSWFFGNSLDSIVLLMVASLGISFAFRGGSFNLGGEGQIYLGGLIASVVLLSFTALPGSIALLLAAFSAAFCGALMGSVSGLLKRLAGADELITSFLLSSGLIPVADYLISGPLRDSTGNLLATPRFDQSRMLLRILPPSSLNISLFIALSLVFCVHIFLSRTAAGYRYRCAGANPVFARFGAIPVERYRIPSMSISGALHGLTGFFAVAGTYGLCHRSFSGGLGWSAIAVALIARNKPLAIIPAALVYGWLKAGADSVLLMGGMNFETGSLIQAAVLLLATVRFSRYLGGKK